MNLGKKIVKLRKDNKMSQEEFAETLNVTRQTVSNWENSKNYPDIETLILISDKFNISLDILLKGDKEMIKNIDNKIKKNKTLKFTIIFLLIIIIVSISFIFLLNNQTIDYFDEDISDKPGVLLGCTYKDEFIDYHIIYNKKTNKPNPKGASYSVGISKEIRSLSNRIYSINTSEFDSVDELAKYVVSIYEKVGANCQIVKYESSEDYRIKSEKMQLEFYDSLY